MKQELAWGTAAAMAIVAAVGISSQSGGKPETGPAGKPGAQTIIATKAPKKGTGENGVQPQCADFIPILEHFFLHEKITGPASCYVAEQPATPLGSSYRTNFVIATLPDPLHTHFSLSFDRSIESIQQAAQDEGYAYDSSWLPWETEESVFSRLEDQDKADDRKEKREDQPGILLFRGTRESPYKTALIVFVVGEESTGGVHRRQFENSVAWIRALQRTGDTRTSVAILGPGFSGSFPSLADLLAKAEGIDKLNGRNGLSIYSGSASSRDDAEKFAETKGVHFRSFVQDDTSALGRVCRYLGDDESRHVAIISEDETAYGYVAAAENFGVAPAEKAQQEKNGVPEQSKAQADNKDTPRFADTYSNSGICPGSVNIYYPRDISALRAAYQTQSMFRSNSAEPNQDNLQRKSLPTDLADPSGQQHDTVRRYAGNQNSLSQEAELLGIVNVLRSHQAHYVILRSSNTLDPVFLANFLRRDYPEARIIIFNADLLFQRGQDAMALTGVMTLSTYPLFSWAREWTPLPPYETHSHRVFPENYTEGTYIAARLLLQTLAPKEGPKPALSCEFVDKDLPLQKQQEVFVPALRCKPTSDKFAPLPDYAPPYWTLAKACEPANNDLTCRPATWLSVITRNGTLPLAALNERTLSKGAEGTNWEPPYEPGHRVWPGTPRTTKYLLITLCFLAAFHFFCCRFASFTAKPAFRAHFATAGELHGWLVLIGSYLINLMTLFVGWGCGIFTMQPGPPSRSYLGWAVVLFVCAVTTYAVVVNIARTRKLNGNAESVRSARLRAIVALLIFAIFTAAFFLLWVWPMQGVLLLANRPLVYWRSMQLTSGVSPLVPFFSLTVGLYIWFWYALHGLALFGPDSPQLPQLDKLVVKFPKPELIEPGKPTELKLSMFSHDRVVEPAQDIAKPLAWSNVIFVLVVFVLLAAFLFGLGSGRPVRSLGQPRYGIMFGIAIVFYSSLILSEGWKILRTWGCARQLLVFLDRMALRRTLSALHGFSWGSVWKMSGNVLDVRYKLLSRQLECLNHLYNTLPPSGDGKRPADAGIDICKESVKDSLASGRDFADWYSTNYNDPNAANLQTFEAFQAQIAATTGVVLTKLLIPATRTEKSSLIQADPDDDCDDDRIAAPQSKDEMIRNAEELVCLTYLGFAQNLLGRVRTIVLGGIYLFIALSIAVSSYPFDPRTLLSGILLILFVVFGGIVVFTYADMHRDVTLSHVTNTKPGELGSEFWFKVVGYGVAPLLGLITQVFPEWSGFLFSWLQPGLSSLK